MAGPFLGVSAPLSLFGGGMPGFSASANSAMNQNGAQFGAAGAGDWNVNVAGSGIASQSATSATKLNWYLIALAAGVAYFVMKK